MTGAFGRAFSSPAAVRRGPAGEPAGQVSVGRHQIFVEVPLRLGRRPQFPGRPLVERVRLRPDHVDLVGQREVDVEAAFAELLDGVGGARLLPAEIVAGHAQDHQPLGLVLVVERLQPGILGREAALRGGIDHQHHLAAELGQRQCCAVDRLEGEIIGGRCLGRKRHGTHQEKAGQKETAANETGTDGWGHRTAPQPCRRSKIGRFALSPTVACAGPQASSPATGTPDRSGSILSATCANSL